MLTLHQYVKSRVSFKVLVASIVNRPQYEEISILPAKTRHLMRQILSQMIGNLEIQQLIN